MRGSDAATGSMFSYVDLEERVPAKHPLRTIRAVVNEVLLALDAELSAMYSRLGRPSIAPEKVLRGSLVQTFYTIRSERLLMEQLDYNPLFRWFVGLGIDDPVWDHSTYSKNRDRLLEADIARKLLKAILEHEKVKPLLSDEHFSVDGTLINAWASMKSFVLKETAPPDQDATPPAADGGAPPKREDEPEPKAEPTPPTPAPTESHSQDTPQDPTRCRSTETESEGRNQEVDFHGQKGSNATHASTTDAEARLLRKGKGKEARLCYIGHALTENRHGLVVEAGLTQATGTAEREAAAALIDAHAPGSTRRLTLGADKAYDAAAFVADMRQKCVTPHVAQNDKGRRSAIDWPHHAARGLRAKPQEAQADRGGLRLGQDDRRPRPADAPRPRPHALRLHLCDGRLRSRPSAAAHRGANCVCRSRMRLRQDPSRGLAPSQTPIAGDSMLS